MLQVQPSHPLLRVCPQEGQEKKRKGPDPIVWLLPDTTCRATLVSGGPVCPWVLPAGAGAPWGLQLHPSKARDRQGRARRMARHLKWGEKLPIWGLWARWEAVIPCDQLGAGLAFLQCK